jgi:hypothetical protein
MYDSYLERNEAGIPMRLCGVDSAGCCGTCPAALVRAHYGNIEIATRGDAMADD